MGIGLACALDEIQALRLTIRTRSLLPGIADAFITSSAARRNWAAGQLGEIGGPDRSARRSEPDGDWLALSC